MTGTIRYWIQETAGSEEFTGEIPLRVNEINDRIIAFMHARALELAKFKHGIADSDSLKWRAVATLDQEETPHEE